MIYKADFHIHTVLSPCGDLDMSPSMIIDQALIKGIDIIGITDHNSTKNTLVTKSLSAKHNILVLCGAEVTSKEEIHCLCFLPDEQSLTIFQEYIDQHINQKKNNVKFFGNQLIVDAKENIIGEEKLLLIQSINQNIYQIQAKVEELNGIFIPSHIDANRNSISSQIGFIPNDLKYDALEVKNIETLKGKMEKYKVPQNAKIVTSSDAHYLSDIGIRTTELEMENLSFVNIKKALSK